MEFAGAENIARFWWGFGGVKLRDGEMSGGPCFRRQPWHVKELCCELQLCVVVVHQSKHLLVVHSSHCAEARMPIPWAVDVSGRLLTDSVQDRTEEQVPGKRNLSMKSFSTCPWVAIRND